VFLENFRILSIEARLPSLKELSHDVVDFVLEKPQVVAHTLLLFPFFIQGSVDRLLLIENGIMALDQLIHRLPFPKGIHSGTAKLDQANEKYNPKGKDQKGLLPSAKLEKQCRYRVHPSSGGGFSFADD
jgi:hypothetical protein